MCVVHQVFVLLAGGASFDVVFYPLVHVQPPIFLFRGLGSFVSSWVSSGGVVVIALHDFSPQFYFRGNYHPMVFEPSGLVVVCRMDIEVVCVLPLFHSLSVGLLCVGYFLS